MSDLKPIKLSACVVVHNEAALIKRCLDSIVGLVDEIIVVHDGECSDETLAIAAAYKADIFLAPRCGVAEPIRPLSFAKARGEWLLQIDADEFLSPALKAAIPELIKKSGVDAYEFFWPLYDGEKYVTKNWPYKRCLFRRAAISFIGLPNFLVEVSGQVQRVKLLLEHRPNYNNYSWKIFKSKWSRWTAIQAALYLSDFSKVPKFNYQGSDWPLSALLRRRFSLLIAPLDFIVIFLKTLASGAWREGLVAWKLAFLLGCSRLLIDWNIFKNRKLLRFPTCLCGRSDYKIYRYKSAGLKFKVLTCTHCGLARTWPAPLTPENLEDFYEKLEDYKDRFDGLELRKKLARRVLKIIKNFYKSGKLLDVGCNLGVFVSEAEAQGFDAFGIDISHIAVTRGQEWLKLKDRLAPGFLKDQGYEAQSFEIITYLHCFEHLEDPLSELKELCRVLKPEAILLIEVPRFFSAWRFLLGNRWYGFVPSQHIWQFGKRGLSNLLKHNGFKIVSAKTRINLEHEITFSPAGIIKALIAVLAWLTGTGDNLIIVAQKES